MNWNLVYLQHLSWFIQEILHALIFRVKFVKLLDYYCNMFSMADHLHHGESYKYSKSLIFHASFSCSIMYVDSLTEKVYCSNVEENI